VPRPESLWFVFVAETDRQSSCAQSTFYTRTEGQYSQNKSLVSRQVRCISRNIFRRYKACLEAGCQQVYTSVRNEVSRSAEEKLILNSRHMQASLCDNASVRPGVVKLALSDPQGVSEAFQGVYDR